MTEADDRTPWLSLTEAAAQTGRHIDALRSLVRRGRLPARKSNNGQWMVQIPSGPNGPQTQSDLATNLAHDVRDRGTDEVISSLMAEVTELREKLASGSRLTEDSRRLCACPPAGDA